MVISKSEYMMFLKHPAWLWLKKYDKSKLPEPDENLQALFDGGALFEEYAERIFEGAVKLGYKNGNEFSGSKYYALPDTTKQEIEKGTKVILQGRVEVDNITSIFDVLERVGENEFNLYEIKSSTSVKPEHIPDLAFQTTVLEKAGYVVKNIYVVHVNNQYVKQGDVDPHEITVTTDVTTEVREIMDETLVNIGKAFKVLANKSEMPDMSPRHLNGCPISEWLPILEAVKGKLPEYSIYNLCLLRADMAGLLEDGGVELIGDIPHDIGLSEKQERQVIATKTGERSIDKAEISEFLGALEFPIYFFDYETLSGVIPVFDHTRPYQQVPFQYSLHIWETPESELVHKEYLHTERTYPVIDMIKQMQEDFGPTGSIISWNKGFEIARNNEMAKAHPEYESFLTNLNDRMVDLMIPFSKGMFVDKRFRGSASLKAVLPVLVPELSYKELDVSHGGQAQRVWMETVLDGKNAESKDRIMEALRKYCHLDTYSMYAVLKYLQENIRSTRV